MAIVTGVLAATLAVTVRRGRVAWIVVVGARRPARGRDEGDRCARPPARRDRALGRLREAAALDGPHRARRDRPGRRRRADRGQRRRPSSGLLDLPGDLVDRLRDEAFAGSALDRRARGRRPPARGLGDPARHRAAPARRAPPGPARARARAVRERVRARDAQRRAAALRGRVLLGAFVGADVPGRVATVRRSAGSRCAAVLVVALVAASDARADRSSDVAARSWDSARRARSPTSSRRTATAAPGVHAAVLQLLLARGRRPARPRPAAAVLGPARPDTFADLDFDQRAGFRGPKSATPPCTDRPLVVTKSDERFGTIFECALLDHVRSEQPRYLVVSGWAARHVRRRPADPVPRGQPRVPPGVLDAAGRLAARRRGLRGGGRPAAAADAPTYYSAAASDALPGDRGSPARWCSTAPATPRRSRRSWPVRRAPPRRGVPGLPGVRHYPRLTDGNPPSPSRARPPARPRPTLAWSGSCVARARRDRVRWRLRRHRRARRRPRSRRPRTR